MIHIQTISDIRNGFCGPRFSSTKEARGLSLVAGLSHMEGLVINAHIAHCTMYSPLPTPWPEDKSEN